MSASNTTSTGTPQATSLASSFGIASLVVIIGVSAGWVTLKNIGQELDFDLPTAVGSADHRAFVVPSGGSESLLERAELAFAAGRIAEPEFDSALGYYAAALDQDPDNADAREGIDRVVSYLVSQAESALFQNDWDAARAHANVILDQQPQNIRAMDISSRANRFERVQSMTEDALAQFSAGRLVAPAGDNAAETYQAILEVDAENSAALQGLASVAQRLIANAQSSALAGDMNQARRFIAQALELNPDVAGVAEVEQLTMRAAQEAEDRALQRDLVAASEALQDDRLMPPAQPNAYSLFSSVLERSPNSDSAQRGIRLVQAALLDRARAQLAAGNIAGSHQAIEDAEQAGVDRDQLDIVRAEIAHQERFADARIGRFDRVYSISELDVIRQVAPEYPRLAAQRGMEGWVVLEFTVTQTGEVRDPKVSESSSSLFDRSAVAAIDRWLFEPIIEDGRAVPVRATLRFAYQPQG